MNEFSPLEDDVWLKGTLVIRVLNARDGQPQRGQKLTIHGCGFR